MVRVLLIGGVWLRGHGLVSRRSSPVTPNDALTACWRSCSFVWCTTRAEKSAISGACSNKNLSLLFFDSVRRSDDALQDSGCLRTEIVSRICRWIFVRCTVWLDCESKARHATGTPTAWWWCTARMAGRGRRTPTISLIIRVSLKRITRRAPTLFTSTSLSHSPLSHFIHD